MKAPWLSAVLFSLSVLVCGSSHLQAQSQSAREWSELIGNHYTVFPDQQYGFQNNIPLKLDFWAPKDNEKPLPTVVYIHGGGWLFGDRTGAIIELFPYFLRGWNIANVEYRMSGQSLAPAAVEDSVCALRWIYRNAKQFHVDTNRIIVTGHSAGGHLALMVGMSDLASGLENECLTDYAFGDVPMKVAAVVNWYGVTDVNDLLDGKDRKNYAVAWLGSQVNRNQIAKQVSPLTYVRSGLPPIITVHGDMDDVVPYSQAIRLHEALTKAGDKNELITIHGGKHGYFSDQDTLAAYDRIWKFLGMNVPGLLPSGK